jgi:hypothetical protein
VEEVAVTVITGLPVPDYIEWWLGCDVLKIAI